MDLVPRINYFNPALKDILHTETAETDSLDENSLIKAFVDKLYEEEREEVWIKQEYSYKMNKVTKEQQIKGIYLSFNNKE